MRYAANDPVAAARERVPARRITAAADALYLVRLTVPSAALHLTHQANLEALDLDDRVNTGRLDEALPGGHDPLLAVSQQLSDAVYDWWDGDPPPIVYRTRTAPSARNLAFTATCAWASVTAGRLRDAHSLLVDLVINHRFDLPDTWL
jgi:hypothetical protein